MTPTGLFMTTVIIVIAIVDCIAVTVGGVDASVSQWFNTVGLKSPAVLLGLGYLLGHFFGFMRARLQEIDVRYVTPVEYFAFVERYAESIADRATKPSGKTSRNANIVVIVLGGSLILTAIMTWK